MYFSIVPLIPTGLGRRLYDRVVNRVRRELGPDTTETAMVPHKPSLADRIKNVVRRVLNIEQPTPALPGEPPEPPLYTGPPRTLEEVKQRIQEAGRQHPPVLLRALYNGRWRDLEPYSYRKRDRDDPHIPLLYAFCHKDNGIEAFKLKKFRDLQVTNRPFQPRWDVEF